MPPETYFGLVVCVCERGGLLGKLKHLPQIPLALLHHSLKQPDLLMILDTSAEYSPEILVYCRPFAIRLPSLSFPFPSALPLWSAAEGFIIYDLAALLIVKSKGAKSEMTSKPD